MSMTSGTCWSTLGSGGCPCSPPSSWLGSSAGPTWLRCCPWSGSARSAGRWSGAVSSRRSARAAMRRGRTSITRSSRRGTDPRQRVRSPAKGRQPPRTSTSQESSHATGAKGLDAPHRHRAGHHASHDDPSPVRHRHGSATATAPATDASAEPATDASTATLPDGATGPAAATSADTLRDYYRQMVLIRRFEERAGEMYTRAKIGGYCHLNLGEEATVVGLMSAMEPRDYLFTTYREHGYAPVSYTHLRAHET